MHVTMTGFVALEKLRMQLEEDAGADFPHDVGTELLVLYDVCRVLELSFFNTQEVLGEKGWAFVRAEINTPVGMPTVQAQRLFASSPALA